MDLTAGKRATWWVKAYEHAVFVDIRESVRPDVVANSCCLPFRNDTFDLVSFDPPHVNVGANSNMTKDYGHHTIQQIRSFILGAAREANRVAKKDAVMAFKWNDHDQGFKAILSLMAPHWEPLFGAKVSVRTKHYSQTAWVLLHRV